jgi:hypothetical protein
VARSSKHDNEYCGSIKDGEFIDFSRGDSSPCVRVLPNIC